MKKFWLARCLVMVAVICAAVCAEGQKQFTLEDLNFGGKNYKQMTPQNRTLVWWGEKLVHTTDSIHYVVDVRTGKEKPLLTLAQMNDALGAAYALTSLRGVSYPYADSSMVVVNTAKRRLLVDFRRGEPVWSQPVSRPNTLSLNMVVSISATRTLRSEPRPSSPSPTRTTVKPLSVPPANASAIPSCV